MSTEFDEIRPYHDEELPEIYEELIADPAFRQVAAYVMPGIPFEALAARMRSCRTKLDFQKTFVYPTGLLYLYIQSSRHCTRQRFPFVASGRSWWGYSRDCHW